ncbi:large ribosomal subunit protein uL22m [Planococcus citri]|uniref:large ribosomal subunit protein uL22m n=1 Tax=Planococcus citri TaxID=170843 RepID=UPI0031F905B8
MWNSVRYVCKKSITQMANFNNSLHPVNAILIRSYADHSKASHMYTNFMNSGPDLTKEDNAKLSKWMKLNEKVYPPQDPSEPPRPAYVCHELINLKYSPKKMWYVCRFVRGLTIDEALKQLALVGRKGAEIATRAINEAADMAVKDHNVEFRTNLWIAECFHGRGVMVKGVRRHAKGRIGLVHYRYCNFYIRLEEGKPPADYYRKGDRSGPALLEKWVTEMRGRKIYNTL